MTPEKKLMTTLQQRPIVLWLACLFATLAIAPAQAQTTYSETVLHDFALFPAPTGELPYAGVIRDAAGNLYGTTYGGGAWNRGAVYKVDTAGHATVLHSFTGGADGGDLRRRIQTGCYRPRDCAAYLYWCGRGIPRSEPNPRSHG